ncbi:MAG TPA: hypothetical protein VEB59_00750, partial [Gemmatimonadales bacterium]|nr:hypothetical protein [Gemmatimonadales bacterium]
MNFAGRLVLGTILVLVLTIGVLLWSAERSLRRDLEADIARTLETEARLVREALPADSTEWSATLRCLGSESGRRLTVVDRGGLVRADSDFPPGPLPPLENHADRPEIREALAGRTGFSTRRSESVGRPLLYVAVPGGPGAVRVAASLTQVDTIVSRAQASVTG